MGYITGVEKLKSLNVSPTRLKVSDKSSTSILKSSITKHRGSLPPRRRAASANWRLRETELKSKTFQFILYEIEHGRIHGGKIGGCRTLETTGRGLRV